ncbi:MAG: threonine/serine dehydratase [Deinococcales bacterium]|jgi:threonine dehydratase
MSPADDASIPTLAELEAAFERVRHAALWTPLVHLDLEGPGGGPVYAKAENLQRTGSFKLRGALNFLASLPPELRARGVVTHSSGNHAQGVAFAARHFGVKATIVIPEGAPHVKVEGTRALGAEVVRCQNTQASRHETAEAIAHRTGATLVPPYDHPWIVAGQASVGLEIAADLPDVANVLVPIGGGGLSSGVTLTLAARAPEARVVGVEPELAADAHASLTGGERVAWPAEDVTRTMADGVRTQSIGELNFRILRRHLVGVQTVSEEEIRDATAWYARGARLVVEPTGALTLAALRRLVRGDGEVAPLRDGPTVVVISGGNVDHELLCRLLEETAGKR